MQRKTTRSIGWFFRLGRRSAAVLHEAEHDLGGRFGGGGHKGAAGATTSLSLEEAAKAVKEAMLEG